MTEKRPLGLPSAKLVAIAAVAGILAGAVAVYVKQTTSGNGTEVADAAQCAASVEKAASLKPFAAGEVAAMIADSGASTSRAASIARSAGTRSPRS